MTQLAALFADADAGSPGLLASVIGLLTALSGAATAAAAVLAAIKHQHDKSVSRLERRDEVTDNRVDLMWRAHLRRGAIEGLNKNLIRRTTLQGDLAMSLVLNEDARRAYEPIAPALRRLRRLLGDPLSPERLAEAIEARYGQWLVRHICEPLGVHDYACLEMARLVALEPDDDAPAPAAAVSPPVPG